MSKKINLYSLASIYFLGWVSFVMYLVMDTAKDRDAYLRIFDNPFDNPRIEIGFQYFAYLFNFLKMPASASVVITSAIIYFLYSRVWFSFIKFHWLVSILLFNFFVFGLMNYYLGTSIRMGLSIGVILYSGAQIMKKKIIYWPVFLSSFIIHYGAILYILVFVWVNIFKNKNLAFHIIFMSVALIALLFGFEVMLPYFGLTNYYMSYIDGEIGRADRVFPLTIAFSVVSLLLIVARLRFSMKMFRELTILAMYSIPFVVFNIFSGNPLFAKMLMPIIFLQAILVSALYYRYSIAVLGNNVLFVILIGFNLIASIYALKMYQFI